METSYIFLFHMYHDTSPLWWVCTCIRLIIYNIYCYWPKKQLCIVIRHKIKYNITSLTCILRMIFFHFFHFFIFIFARNYCGTFSLSTCVARAMQSVNSRMQLLDLDVSFCLRNWACFPPRRTQFPRSCHRHFRALSRRFNELGFSCLGQIQNPFTPFSFLILIPATILLFFLSE